MIFDEDLPPQHSLNANIYTIKMLTRRPGMPYFSFWFIVSTFTPIMSACVGPLANMISIGAIVDPWRNDPTSSHKIPDSGWVLGLNIASLIIGFGANILLVLNFTGKLRYTIAQVGSTALWLMASIVLSVTLIVAWRTGYFDGYERSGGFYLGCFTSGLYFVCFCLLAVNYGGYLMGEYDATFNLDQPQRGLMIHTVMLGAWLCIGPGMFMHLVNSSPWDSYATSLYYSIILVTTIGLGDVLPLNNAGRGLSLAYAFFGVLELGLIISWLRQFVLSNIGPTLFWHRLEQSRQKAKKALEEHNVVLNGRQSFELISRLRSRCEIIQKLRSVFFTLGFYTVFWLMGALVFTYVEDWTYFISVYFAFLCLITIGFGDFAPKTPLGRAFFVVWSLSAVPMMTMLITSVGDAMFAIASHMDDFLSSVTGLKQQLYVAEDAMIEEHWFRRECRELETDMDEEQAREELRRMYTSKGKQNHSLRGLHHWLKPHRQNLRSRPRSFPRTESRRRSMSRPRRASEHQPYYDREFDHHENHHTLLETVPQILRALSPGRTLRAISSIVSEDRIREDIEEEERQERALRKEEHNRVHGSGRSRNNSVEIAVGRASQDEQEGGHDNSNDNEEEEGRGINGNGDNDVDDSSSLDRIHSQASPGTGGVGSSDADDSSDSEERMILDHIVMDAEEYRRESVRIVDMLLASINNDPDKIHSFEEWASMYYLLGEDPMEPMLFLSDRSPLRYPLKEGNYMMNRVMRDLENRVDLSDEAPSTPSGTSLRFRGNNYSRSMRRPRSIVRSSRASQVSIHARDRSQPPKDASKLSPEGPQADEKPKGQQSNENSSGRVSSDSMSSSSSSLSSSSGSSSSASSSSDSSPSASQPSQCTEGCPQCCESCVCGCHSSSVAGVPPPST